LKDYKKFVSRLSFFVLLGLVPIIIIGVDYVYSDPFKIIYKPYDINNELVLQRDLETTEKFLKNKNNYRYNSFIFGSSRSQALRPSIWKSKLRRDDLPFSFDSHGETIFGITNKIIFLDSIGIKIDNAIILLCRDLTFSGTSNNNQYLYISHPTISGESFLYYNLVLFERYMNIDFLIKYFTYRITGKYKPFMKNVIKDNSIVSDSISNEIKMIEYDRKIFERGEKYYLEKKNIFYNRESERVDSETQINEKIFLMLKSIQKIFEKHKTNYKIVISPLYEQVKYSSHDLKMLEELFGDSLYDFSGRNTFTESFFNYYEESHFRPFIGDSIINVLYKNEY